MILLDSNAVSELARPRIDPSFAEFIGAQALADVFVPSLVVAEIRFGIHRLPDGQRRRDLNQRFTAFLDAGFGGRIVVFDEACATGYATARITRERAGRPAAVMDLLIGGMALAHRATVVTRNTADFDGYGLSLINPWAS